MKNKNDQKKKDTFHYNDEVNLRSILHNAIKMQALYKGKRVSIIESSLLTN